MQKIIISFIAFIISASLFAQNIDYAKTVINKLSSEEFKGRGFVENGDKIAANFIKSQLDSIGIKSLNTNFFQKFELPINTIQGEVNLSLEKTKINLGTDYLISPNAASSSGKYKVKTIKLSKISKYAKKDFSEKFLYINNDINTKESKKLYRELIYTNSFNARGFINPVDKPTHRQSMVVDSFTVLNIRKDLILNIPKYINIDFKNTFYENYQTQNVLGYIQGEVDSFIVFTAHYDHLGKQGNTATFYGANDNASGCSMLLNLADYLTKKEKPHYSIAFMFFSAEEAGLVGSAYYVNNSIFDLQKIKFLFNLDMVGTGEKGIRIVNSTIFTEEYDLLVKINDKENYLKQILKRGEAANSDHHPFYAKGVPAYFIFTTGGSSEYHNVYDKPEKLSLFAFENLLLLLSDFIDEYR